jgi:hypothetical protein
MQPPNYEKAMTHMSLLKISMQMSEMNQTIDDRAFMLQILSNLGDDYELVQFHLDHRMFSTVNPLTIEELCMELKNTNMLLIIARQGIHPRINHDLKVKIEL